MQGQQTFVSTMMTSLRSGIYNYGSQTLVILQASMADERVSIVISKLAKNSTSSRGPAKRAL